MQRILCQYDMAVGKNIRIRQINGEQGIIIAQIRAEQERLHSTHEQFEPRQESRIAAKQPVRSTG